jgi:hypothetical protein
MLIAAVHSIFQQACFAQAPAGDKPVSATETATGQRVQASPEADASSSDSKPDKKKKGRERGAFMVAAPISRPVLDTRLQLDPNLGQPGFVIAATPEGGSHVGTHAVPPIRIHSVACSSAAGGEDWGGFRRVTRKRPGNF